MHPTLFRTASLVFLLSAPLTPVSSPTQAIFGFWFETSGVSPEHAEMIASHFAEAAGDSARLSAAARLEAPDIVIHLTVRGAVADGGGMRPLGLGLGPQGTSDGGRGGAQLEQESAATVDVSLRAVDVLAGELLYDERHRCELPLTQGRFVATCLRTSFPRIVERLEEWAEREAATFAAAADYGPSDADVRRLGAGDLATVYFREGVRASRDGFENKALELMAAAQPLLKETGRRREEAAAWEHLAYLMVATRRGADRAIDYAEQTVRIARELSDEALEARGLALLAACEARAGHYDRAARIARSAAGSASSVGNALTEGMSVAIQAGVAAVQGNLDQARELQAQALELVGSADQPLAAARIELAAAAVAAQHDDRMRSTALAMIAALQARATALGDLALHRDVAFVAADTRAATTEIALVSAAEIDAVRALKLSARLDDEVGAAAAVGLLGVLGVRLGKLARAFEYLSEAQQRAEQAGFLEGATDSLQVLGEEVPDLTYGIELLQAALALRVEQGDLRGQIKTLSDLSRLQSGLGRTEDAWASHRAAGEVLERYLAALREGGGRDDLGESFTTVLRSLVATRTELPYLARYLRLHPMIPMPNPTWVES